MSSPHASSDKPATAPIRIKLYGLVSVTRRGYLVMVATGAVLLSLMLGVWLSWISHSAKVSDSTPGSVKVVLLLLDHLYLVVLVLALLLGVEAYFVLRRFAREQAQRRATPTEPASPTLTS